jgi:MFS family permease
LEITPPRRRFVFLMATGLIGAEVVLFTMVVPALPVFAEQYGFSDSVAALIFAAFPVAQLVLAIASAGVVERFGRRPAMIGAATTLLVATLAFALANSVATLTAARGLQGAAAGVAWTAGIAAISDVYPASELGFRIGLAETSGGAAGLLGPVIGGLLIQSVGTQTTFLLAALLPAALIVPTLFVPETRRPDAPQLPRLIPALGRLARQPRARAGGVALAILAAVLAFIEPLLPLDLTERLGLEPVAVGLVFSAALVTNLAGAPLAGRWSDRHGRRAPILAGGVILAVSLPMLGFGPVWWVAGWMLVVGAGFAIVASPSGPLLTMAVDDAGMHGAYGLSAGVLTVVFAFGYAFGPLGGAAGRAVLPFWLLCVILGALALGAAVWAWRQLAGVPGASVGATSDDGSPGTTEAAAR